MALNTIKKNWQAINDKFIDKDDYFYLTPSHLSFYKTLLPVIKKYAKGNLIDLGAGKLILRNFVLPIVSKYQSLDIKKTHPELDFVANIEKMPLKNNSFDSILCIQVLEHAPSFWLALDEIARILKKDGVLILSVPHLSYLHGAPFDYYRFTKFALKKLLSERKMKIIKIIPVGGFFSFIFTGPLIFLLSLFYPLLFLREFSFFLNKYISKFIVFLDENFDKEKIYALNYIVIAKKI